MGLFDSLLGSDDSNAQNYLTNAANQYKDINVPTIASEQVNNLPMETVQGTVNPENIQVAQQAPSALNAIALDPETRAAQIAALNSYTNIANSGGLDANAQLALNQTINAAKEESQGAQGAIMNAAQAEGQGGGDFALAQRAIAAQGASNTAATNGLQAAAEAEANREAALNQMATIGGNVNASDYSQAANTAASQNAVNATNAAATNAANTGNVANKIQTGEFNTNTAQGVNAANTTAGQDQVYYNANLPQQQFNNELAKAGGVAGVAGQQAATATGAANNTAAGLGKLIGAGGTLAATAFGGPVAGALTSQALSSSSAPIGGGKTTPTGNNANPSNYGMSDGGVVEKCYAKGGMAHDHGMCLKMGGFLKGHALVPGDSEINDTIHAKLSPGELVIPRSVPKTGPEMEKFAKNAPVPGTNKKVDLTQFTAGYKRGK